MRLEPSSPATHLSWLSFLLLVAGILLQEESFLLVGSALLLGVALSRASSRLHVARIRAAGFEMLWMTGGRSQKIPRNKPLTLTLELRNRDTLPLRVSDLHILHAPALRIQVHPQEGEIPAQGRLPVHLHITGARVGYQGIHGVHLQVSRPPGLFSVPLSFENPFVLEVLPGSIRWGKLGAIGGRSPALSNSQKARGRRGEGSEFHEIREHRPGDSFHSIAWKASARRSRLLVIEKERDENESVWVFVDASLESASGAPGEAPLDAALDQAAALLESHLAQGDRVGLSLFSTRELVRVPLGRGAAHLAQLIQALSFSSHTSDSDRSDWDEEDIKRRVIEHLRSLQPGLSLPSSSTPEQVVSALRPVQKKAPVSPSLPLAPGRTERLLRRYLLSFGIQSPPRGTPDRLASERFLAQLLRELAGQRPRPDQIHLFLRPPQFGSAPELLQALGQLTRRRIHVHFHPLQELPQAPSESWRSQLVRDALRLRLNIQMQQAHTELRRAGVQLSSHSERSH